MNNSGQTTSPPAGGFTRLAERDPYQRRGDTAQFPPPSPLAGRFTRLLACLFDALVLVLVASLPGLLIAFLLQDRGEAMLILGLLAPGEGRSVEPGIHLGSAIVILAVLVLGIIQIVLLSTRGQTISKRLVGVQIVRYHDEKTPGFVRAVLLRSFLNGLIGVVPFVGPLYLLVDGLFIFGEERRCIHDLIAGTKVVEAHGKRAS